MKFVINIFKTDIEQTNSTEFYANVFQMATCKFFICRRTVIDDLDIRITYFLLYSDPVYPFDALIFIKQL